MCPSIDPKIPPPCNEVEREREKKRARKKGSPFPSAHVRKKKKSFSCKGHNTVAVQGGRKVPCTNREGGRVQVVRIQVNTAEMTSLL